MGDVIRVRGARTHNLRAIDLDIPRGKIVVFTGVSGSGKSSLVFDTLCAEGQRRYIESLSPFVRPYLDQLPRPEVDSIEGLPPTLAVSQSGLDRARHPRSLVATLTEIHDYLRLLYARVGQVFCYRCGRALGQQSAGEILATLAALPEGIRLHLLAPLVRGKKGQQQEALDLIRREGFVRVRLDGEIYSLDQLPMIDPTKPHDVEMVVDRQIVRPDGSTRLAESIETALRFGKGSVIVSQAASSSDPPTDLVFNTLLACVDCGVSYREIEPRTFSFNSPNGACPHCEGLGIVQDVSLNKVVPDPTRTLREGALVPFRTSSGKMTPSLRKDLEAWVKEESVWETPWADLPASLREIIWTGNSSFKGVHCRLKEAIESKHPEAREWAFPYLLDTPCPTCQGERLGPEGRSVRVGGRSLPEFLALSMDRALEALPQISIRPERRPLADPLLEEIQRRLTFLTRVGVGYIELNRPVWTLSGGEAQRIRLASCLGSGLEGVCYVLDEPTMGLHPRDTARLLDTLTDLKARSSTVLIVEHDDQAMERADWLVEIGPRAGRQGGELVDQGPPKAIRSGTSATGLYWSGRRKIERPERAATVDVPSDVLVLEGATHHNLSDVTLCLPLGRLVGITGVSGSGKSSLLLDVLVPALRCRLTGQPLPSTVRTLTGGDSIAQVAVVDQSPIGRTPRSCPATFVEMMDPIRRMFAQSREARLRGFGLNRFSFNTKEGRCPECEGLGARRIDIPFLPEIFTPCRTCHGKRFSRPTLSVRFKGRSIGDVLDLTIDEGIDYFAHQPRIARTLATLASVGLGYLPLGQWGTTLSGGEAQRLKLARELSKPKVEPTLFVLDEPTTGLHFQDVDRLLLLLSRLVDQGHSVVVIEHHMDLIQAADWVIDLGPEGGEAGGKIVAEGTPADLAAQRTSATGVALADHLKRRGASADP